MKYLVLGNGGREHALVWKLSASNNVEAIYCMPGNAGTSITPKCVNVPVVPTHEVGKWAFNQGIDCVLPGNEALLMEGIVDICKDAGITVFGPHKSAALLEGSKVFAKEFMQQNGVRTASYCSTSSFEEAFSFAQSCMYPLVVKADGLASGKGVVICQNKQEAESILQKIMIEKVFGDSGKSVVLEQYLDGFEASLITMYDGRKITPFISAKDHKKIHNGEQGLNTGGMGVVAPNPFFTQAMYDDFIQNIMIPTERGLSHKRLQFSGFIFFGIMVVNDLCYLLEYNVRLGDPEAQALLPLLDSDISTHIINAIDGALEPSSLIWKNASSCCVVLASAGYPQAYETGKVILGLNTVSDNVFYAGIEQKNEQCITSGGRVMSIVGVGNTLSDAQRSAYKSIDAIHFDGMYFRTDIGNT